MINPQYWVPLLFLHKLPLNIRVSCRNKQRSYYSPCLCVNTDSYCTLWVFISMQTRQLGEWSTSPRANKAEIHPGRLLMVQQTAQSAPVWLALLFGNAVWVIRILMDAPELPTPTSNGCPPRYESPPTWKRSVVAEKQLSNCLVYTVWMILFWNPRCPPQKAL